MPHGSSRKWNVDGGTTERSVRCCIFALVWLALVTLHRSKAGGCLERSVDIGTRSLDQVDVDAGEGSRDQAGENAIIARPWHVLAHDDDGVGAGKISYDFLVWMSKLKWSSSTIQYSRLYRLTNAFGPSHIYPSYDSSPRPKLNVKLRNKHFRRALYLPIQP